ncbi:MarR family transcriptional regulator [Bacillus sp. HMF5848]|nr:MarR family transcriptional regulator [Bacillus sp. HMF5848]
MGGKWKSRILWHLNNKSYRYGELRKLIPEITQKVLTQALREMEEDGLVKRTIYEGAIQHVEYSLTDYGHSLSPVLQVMSQWGSMHILRERELRKKEEKTVD